MSENKDEILANFQSITGIDDVGEAFSHLEETDWDLMTAIERVMPHDDTPAPPIGPANIGYDMPPPNFSVSSSSTRANFFNNFTTNANATINSRWNADQNAIRTGFLPVASTSSSSAQANIIDLTNDAVGLDATNTNKRQFIFHIHFNQEIYTIRLPSTARIEQLKHKIQDKANVPICRQAIRGWPPAKLSQALIPTTLLSELELAAENDLILIDLTEEGYMDYENDDDEATNRRRQDFYLNIVVQPGGENITLKLKGHTTLLEVKSNVYCITNIPVRHQEWTGWPDGCTNLTSLAQSGIETHHNLFMKSNAAALAANNSTESNNLLPVDTDSSADEEFEDASDFNASEDFYTDMPAATQTSSRHLIANNTDNETTGSIQFLENYRQRFGQPHPEFYTGSLEDALKAACHKPARERKLLAIYLHHGESILTNVFCDHLMKHESIIQSLDHNFVLYGWDLTFESNKHMLLSSITACVNNTASLTVRNIPLDKLPAILIIGKSRISGRSSCEVLSVIHGNVGLDDLLSRLIESVEMYSQHLQVEIREEDERAARDQVKAEQDMAYQEALEVDMAKEEAKRHKEASIAAERQRLESERAEEDARKESIRLVAEQSLPLEPNENEANISKIRVRKPTGEFLERRFYIQNTLQDLLNFVAARGFLIEEYKVISGWPRRDLTSIDANQTLQSLKLYPQETVMLEER